MAGRGTGSASLQALIDKAPGRNMRPETCWICDTLTPDDRATLDRALLDKRVSQARLAVVLQEAGYADARESRIQSHWAKHVKAG